MNSLDTSNLIITKKRKKWKFAHFNSWENCFTFTPSSNSPSLTSSLFPGSVLGNKRVLEVGAGDGGFSLELARRNTENQYVAIDVKSDRLYTSAKRALNEGISNIKFLRCNIGRGLGTDTLKKGVCDKKWSFDTQQGALVDIFGDTKVDEIWITFPDPHPKKSSAKHRLTDSGYLRQYRNILKQTGTLNFKTDNRELFLWSLEQFAREKWQIKELSFDLHESNLSDEYKIKTTYERKYLMAGICTNFVSLTRPES